MAVVATVSNHFKYQLAYGSIDLSSHECRIALMNNSFVFDKDSDSIYPAIISNELPSSGGYTREGIALLLPNISEDTSNDKAIVEWAQAIFEFSGDAGPTGAAIVYDNDSGDRTIIMCIDFGIDYTLASGDQLKITPRLEIL